MQWSFVSHSLQSWLLCSKINVIQQRTGVIKSFWAHYDLECSRLTLGFLSALFWSTTWLEKNPKKKCRTYWKKETQKILKWDLSCLNSDFVKIPMFSVTFMRCFSLSKDTGSSQFSVMLRSSFPLNHKPTWFHK